MTSSHGGKREGAGRPSRYSTRKEQRRVSLTPAAWAYINRQAGTSTNERLEGLIRRQSDFQEIRDEQR